MKLDVRYANHPDDSKKYDTEELRKHYLIQTVFEADEIVFTYSHQDRMIAGGVMPVNKAVVLKQVLDHYHIKEDEVMVVGDSGNDVPLFNNFPNSFVTKHAPEEVKKQAKYVVESVADLKSYCK